jgi:hypothetical protein
MGRTMAMIRHFLSAEYGDCRFRMREVHGCIRRCRIRTIRLRNSSPSSSNSPKNPFASVNFHTNDACSRSDFSTVRVCQGRRGE